MEIFLFCISKPNLLFESRPLYLSVSHVPCQLAVCLEREEGGGRASGQAPGSLNILSSGRERWVY